MAFEEAGAEFSIAPLNQTTKPTMSNPTGIGPVRPPSKPRTPRAPGKVSKPRTPGIPAEPMRMNNNRSLNGFTTGNPEWDDYIVRYSNEYNIDPLLTFAQMNQESSFRRNATSPKGAGGLMQLMPATARRFGVTDVYDPIQNIRAGVRYTRWLLDKFGGNVPLALAGYNAGEGAVMKYGNQIPPYKETRNYVTRITSHYQKLSSGTGMSTRTPAVRPSRADKSFQNVRQLAPNLNTPFSNFLDSKIKQ